MPGCSEITMGSTTVDDDCDLIPPAGTEPVAILWNTKDVESYVYGTDGQIEDVILKAGKFAYKFTGFDQAFPNSEDFQRSATTGRGQWKHKPTIVIYDRTQLQKNNVKSFGNSRVSGALFMKGTDNDSILLAGKDVGMQLVAGTIRSSIANDGFFVLPLSTPDGDIENESGPMPSIYDGVSIESTTAMLEALVAAS
jgi:hypothetical protein